jgi:hypothetical protein
MTSPCRRLAGPGLEAARTSCIGKSSTRPPPTGRMRHLMKEMVHASCPSYQRLAALIVKRFAALVVKRFAALVLKRFAALAVKRFAALVLQSTAFVADVAVDAAALGSAVIIHCYVQDAELRGRLWRASRRHLRGQGHWPPRRRRHERRHERRSEQRRRLSEPAKRSTSPLRSEFLKKQFGPPWP